MLGLVMYGITLYLADLVRELYFRPRWGDITSKDAQLHPTHGGFSAILHLP